MPKLLRRQKQEAYKFKGCLCYPVSARVSLGNLRRFTQNKKNGLEL